MPLNGESVTKFWRTDDPVIEDGVVVLGGMFEHQRAWWNLPNFIRGLVTGYGGGKSMMLAKRTIWLALKNAPVMVGTISPSYPMARTTIVAAIDELLEGKCRNESSKPGRRMTYRFIRSTPYRFEITLEDKRYGTRHAHIICLSGDKPDALKGSNLAALNIDEPFLMGEEVFQQSLARVRHPQAVLREINIGGTPEGVLNWGYDLFEGELGRELDVGLIQASTTANLALPDEYAGTLTSAYDENAVAAYRDGQFVNLSTGRIYHAFDPTVHATDFGKDAPEGSKLGFWMPDGAELGCGMDFNVDPMAFCVFWRRGDQLHFVREYEMPNSDTESVAKRLREDYGDALQKIYPDASGSKRSTSSPHGRSDFKVLREEGFQIVARSTNPLRRDRFNAVNAGFNRGRVTIASTCRKMRTYMMAATHKDANTARQKAMGHLLDAMGYPIAYLFPATGEPVRKVPFKGA